MAPQARIKFFVWFGYYAPYFSDLATQCQDEINGYHNTTSQCALVVDCIIGQTTESIKSNMQAASITLGLMPVILPFLAPTMTEMAILAQSWPFFFLVASLGTPSASISSLTQANGVSQLKEGPQSLRWLHDVLAARVKQWKGWFVVMKASTYFLALAAVINQVEVSYRTDVRTASGFRCGQDMMPLVWAELSIICFGFAALAIRWREWRARHSKDTQAAANVLAAQAEILWVLGGLAAELQLVYGIIVFSALIFISTVDAVFVFLRYAASCALCRLLVVMALALARLEGDMRHHKNVGRTQSIARSSISQRRRRIRTPRTSELRRLSTRPQQQGP